MKAIILTEREFNLSVDKLKTDLTAALEKSRIDNPLFEGSFSKCVTYYVETFRKETSEGDTRFFRG